MRSCLSKNERKVIRGHGDTLGKLKSIPGGKDRDLVQVANPPSPVARPEVQVEGQIAGRRLDAGFDEGSVEEQHVANVQEPARARHQTLGRHPRRDVDHVDRDNRIGPIDRPIIRA